MQNDSYLKNYLHLHFIVFIWGFTAVLGKLISLETLDLVWYRMLLASFFVYLFLKFKTVPTKVTKRALLSFTIAGLIIMFHWLTFYESIKVSKVSITLVCMSTGAFFTSILEPILYKRKVIAYEVILGLVTILGIGIIFNVETEYKTGIFLALISSFLSALFSVYNGRLVKHFNPNVISFYELFIGMLGITVYFLFTGKFEPEFFKISWEDLMWLFILSSICTAYAFSASVKVMQFLSPFTVMLTINLEPIYGILLALLIFEESEQMNSLFYLGALIILLTVVLNGILKNYRKKSIVKE